MTGTPSDYGTIKVPRDDYERHNEQRKSNGQTWAEYIDGQAPDVDHFGIAEAVIDELEREHDKTQELAEQPRDAAQRVEEGMGR